MKIELKKLVGTKWHPVPLEELLGKSVAYYIANTDEQCVAAMFHDGKAVAFISNRNEMVEKLRAKGLSLHAEDCLVLFEHVPKIALVAGTFKGSTFIERSLTDKVS